MKYSVMKANLILLFFLASAWRAHAQGDASRNLSIKKPAVEISEDSQWTGFTKEMIRIHVKELPDKIREKLSFDALYKGWENMTFYYDSATEIYVMEVKDGITTKLIRFDKDGNTISGNIPDQE